MAQFDVVVVGLGAMGSAALHQLARRGVRVVGIERLMPGHDQGSSHGESRIIRLGYFEHPSYVPLLRRTYALWRELEAASGTKLLHITGIAEIGPPDGEVVAGTLAASPAARAAARGHGRGRDDAALSGVQNPGRIMSAYSSPMAASSRSSPRSPR